MNAANFTNTGYLLRIKAAVVRAVRKANRPNQPRGIAQETVYNRREKPSLNIVARAGRGFEVFGGRDLDHDVTHLVKAALQRLHGSVCTNVQPSRWPVWGYGGDASCTNARDVTPRQLQGSLTKGLAYAALLCLPFWAGAAHFAFNWG